MNERRFAARQKGFAELNEMGEESARSLKIDS